MLALFVTLHVLVSFIMIGVVLLQAGKGAEIGAAFGGSSQTIFGSRGPGTFLSKMTVAAAIIFMFTSLALSIISNNRSVVSKMKIEPPVEEAPAEPAPVTGEVPPILPAEEGKKSAEPSQSTAPAAPAAKEAQPAPETPPAAPESP
jgi:preprotein translocase subunit SecG